MALQDIVTLGGFFSLTVQWGKSATGNLFLLLLPEKNTIEQSPPCTGCSHSCHTPIFSFKMQKEGKVILLEEQFTFQFSSFVCVKMAVR